MPLLSLESAVTGTGPLLPQPASGSPTASRTSLAVTPLYVAPPLSPCQAGAQAGAYTEKVWRGGLPNPCGHPRGGAAGGGWFGGVPVGDTGPIDAPLPLPVPAVPLPARCNVAMIESVLSGGASGDSWAVWLGSCT